MQFANYLLTFTTDNMPYDYIYDKDSFKLIKMKETFDVLAIPKNLTAAKMLIFWQ